MFKFLIVCIFFYKKFKLCFCNVSYFFKQFSLVNNELYEFIEIIVINFYCFEEKEKNESNKIYNI